eukprot:3326305-Rhodomonas_salina.1
MSSDAAQVPAQICIAQNATRCVMRQSDAGHLGWNRHDMRGKTPQEELVSNKIKVCLPHNLCFQPVLCCPLHVAVDSVCLRV